MTTSNEHTTAEYFQAMFADILADVGTGIAERDQEVAVAMLEGFERAIMDWLDYHDNCQKSYRLLHPRFLGIDR